MFEFFDHAVFGGARLSEERRSAIIREFTRSCNRRIESEPAVRSRTADRISVDIDGATGAAVDANPAIRAGGRVDDAHPALAAFEYIFGADQFAGACVLAEIVIDRDSHGKSPSI